MSVHIYGGGGGGAYSDDTTATKAQVLQGYTAVTSDSNDEAIAGTMIDNKKVEKTLDCGGAINLSGYYAPGSKITANTLAQQTKADATAAYILKGKTAWINGQKVTGTLTVSGVTSFKVTVVNYNTVTCEWTWGNDSRLYSGVAIRYNASSTAPTTATSGTKGYTGIGSNKTGTSTCTITGLKENTVYSFALFTYLSTSAGTLYSSSRTVVNIRTPFQYYTATVYDGSKFSDFMKSGVNGEWMNAYYVGKSGLNLKPQGQPQNTSTYPARITSGPLWMDHTDEGYDYGYASAYFTSYDLINFSKFKSITISGHQFFTFVTNDPASIEYDPYIYMAMCSSNNVNSPSIVSNSNVARDIYDTPRKKSGSSEGGDGGISGTWSDDFTLTFDISKWTETSKYLYVGIRSVWDGFNNRGDEGRAAISITKIIFNV